VYLLGIPRVVDQNTVEGDKQEQLPIALALEDPEHSLDSCHISSDRKAHTNLRRLSRDLCTQNDDAT
jgi:hypothetical protein